jgi:hypothetical protein
LPNVANIIGGMLWQWYPIDPAREPGCGNHRNRQQHKAGKSDAPAKTFVQDLPERRRQQCAERSRRRDDAEHGGAHRLRHRAGRDRHRNRGRGASERGADQHTAADHDTDEPLRTRHQHKPRDVEQRAHHHNRAKAVSHGHGAGERLQEAPGEVLHRQRQRELRHRDTDVVRKRLQEDAERLP